MSKYKIYNGNTSYEVHESAGLCVEASTSIDWCISLPFSYLTSYCAKKGWRVVPVIENEKPQSFEFRGIRYNLQWNGNQIICITMIDDDDEERVISWKELPEQLKGLL